MGKIEFDHNGGKADNKGKLTCKVEPLLTLHNPTHERQTRTLPYLLMHNSTHSIQPSERKPFTKPKNLHGHREQR